MLTYLCYDNIHESSSWTRFKKRADHSSIMLSLRHAAHYILFSTDKSNNRIIRPCASSLNTYHSISNVKNMLAPSHQNRQTLRSQAFGYDTEPNPKTTTNMSNAEDPSYMV